MPAAESNREERPLHFVLCLYAYFPFGGMQRDALAIAEALVASGVRVSFWTSQWDGARPAAIDVQILRVQGRANYRRMRSFASAVAERAAEKQPDLIIGFNRIAGLDAYYAADTCFIARKTGWLRSVERLLPRYRTYASQEAAVFAAGQSAHVLAITPREARCYQEHYGTEEERITLLPPGIRRSFIAGADWLERRRELRRELGIADNHKLLITVASAFRTKGLDRSLRAFAALCAGESGQSQAGERAHFAIVGRGDPGAYRGLIDRLGIADRTHFHSERSDVERFLWAADLMIHPARRENTGTVILEALVAGLPVLTVAACGYAHYVRGAKMGSVLPSPFDQQALNECLPDLLFAGEREEFLRRGQAFAQSADFYGMPQRAVEALMGLASRECTPS